MKTIQVAYLESTASHKWMQKNLKGQEKSRFIREATAAKIAGLENLEKTKVTRKKK